MTDEGIYRVTFVCTANMVRSVMAEGILRKKLDKSGVESVLADSAGTMRLTGVSAAGKAVSVCARHGIDVGNHRSKQVDAGVIALSDLILTMTEEHRDYIVSVWSEAKDRTFTLRGFESDRESGQLDVYDPIRDGEDEYERIFNLLESEIERVLPEIFKAAGVKGEER